MNLVELREVPEVDIAKVSGGLDALVDRLAGSFASRLVPEAASRLPARIGITVATTEGVFGRTVVLDDSGTTIEPSFDEDADVVLSWERISDFVHVETGARLLMSMLRCARASVRAKDRNQLTLVIAMLPSPTDPEPATRDVALFPAWAIGKTRDEVAERVRGVGLDALHQFYARAQREALDLSDVRDVVPTVSWSFEVVDGDEQSGIQVVITPEGSHARSGVGLESDIRMRWTSIVDFALYAARLLDFREAIMTGSAQLYGDRDLATAVYSRMGRHGL